MKKILFALSILLFASCQQEDIENNSLLPLNESKSIPASQIVAENAAKDFFYQVTNTTGTRTTEDIVESIYALKKSFFFTATRANDDISSLPDTVMYVVNLKDDNGFILLSASSQSDDIIAYVEHGTFTPSTQIDNPGFLLYMDGLKDYLVESYANKPLLVDTVPVSHERPTDPNIKGIIEKIIYPILTTNWHQNDPFNRFCFTPNGAQAVAGCVAVAIGQIVSNFQIPTSYNGHSYQWNEILTGTEPQTEAGLNSVGYLISDIGHLVNMDYAESSSGAFDSEVPECLDSLGYSYSAFVPFDFDSCMVNFSQNRAIYIAGSSQIVEHKRYRHAWVVDGGIIRRGGAIGFQLVNGELEPVYKKDNFVHCNWGWGGNLNGYFKSDALYYLRKYYTNDGSLAAHGSEENPQYNFEYNICVYKDIYPINN